MIYKQRKKNGFQKIINDYQNFVKLNKQIVDDSKYVILRFPDANSHSLALNKIINLKNNTNNTNNIILSRNQIEEFKNQYFQKNYKILSKIPKIIYKLIGIKSPYNFFYINFVPHDPYDINIPMTIGLYGNENKIGKLIIKKIVKYFIYFHKQELQNHLTQKNFNEKEFEIYISQEIKKN